MAAAKRKTSSSGGTRKKSTSAAKNNGNDKVLWSTVLFASALLVLAFTVIKGESAWLGVHNFLLGMFGMTVFLVPPAMIYASLMIARDRSGGDVKGKVFQGIILIVILCGALQIFGVGKLEGKPGFIQLVKELYESGSLVIGGGVTSIILGIPLMALFGRTGAGIIIVLLGFVWIMLLANKTVVDVVNLFRGFFAAANDARAEYREVEAPPKRRRSNQDAEEGFTAPPGARKKKNVHDEENIPDNRSGFNIDIPISGEARTAEKKRSSVEEEADAIARTIASNEAAKAAAKEKQQELKNQAAEAKKNLTEASSDLDALIKKAALSGRTARQSKEAAEMERKKTFLSNPFGASEKPTSENTNKKIDLEKSSVPEKTARIIPFVPAAQESHNDNEEDAQMPVSHTAVRTVISPFAADEADVVTDDLPDSVGKSIAISPRTPAPVQPVRRDPAPVPKPLISKEKNFDRVQKSSTLASNKITDDEELDMPETLTAHDIQQEINAEAKPVIEYNPPPIDLLKPSHNDQNAADAEAEMKNNADTLVETLKSFGVMTRIVDIHRGPTVTRYEIQPSAGVKISKITNLSDDIALNLAAEGVRIEAPIPGKAAVGIEVPNRVKDIVTMRDIIDSEEFKNAESKLTFAVGKNIDGEIVLGDISKLPHIIIAGTTGSGKSVCTNGIIMSILYNATPDEVRLVLIDPKVVEFKIYDGIPHLLIPVVTDPRKAAGALAWAVQEMLKRYKLFADNNVRDINGYNEKANETDGMDPLPRIVIVIDELADLMMAAAGEVEDSICRLAQMARAAGMHLIIATQRPTVDVITGLIKANIPSRIALKVSSGIDSRAIINEIGAEKLLGHGDMLYFPTTFAKPLRVQNCFTSDKEVQAVVEYIKTGSGNVEYDENIMNEIEKSIPAAKGEKPADNGKSYDSGSDDDLIERAVACVVENGQCSTSYLQRKLKLGYARAARIVDELEEMGVVGPQDGAKPRQVLMTMEMYTQRKLGIEPDMYYGEDSGEYSYADEASGE